jgi:hypothetical protein
MNFTLSRNRDRGGFAFLFPPIGLENCLAGALGTPYQGQPALGVEHTGGCPEMGGR